IVTIDHLPAEVSGRTSAGQTVPASSGGTSRQRERLSRDERLRRQRDELIRALAEAKGNKAEAARALGIPRSTLLSRMQKFGLG
ncbi:MAG: hypothetical protein N2039_09785, partial [Gemmataceae bacterium]|nr:hypothetical protein [Gemmataceae bacterium]